MKRITTLILSCLGLFSLNAQTPLYFGTHDANTIEVLDTTGGTFSLSNTLTLTTDNGGVVEGTFGLSLHPDSNAMFILYKSDNYDGQMGRRLGVLNVTTGAITDLGDAGNCTDICFFGNRLFANLGDPSGYTFIEINPADGSQILGVTINGGFGYGHSLAWNYYTNKIFRTDDDYDTYFEIDPIAGTSTNLNPSSYPSASDYTNASVLLNDSTMLVSGGVEIYTINLNDWSDNVVYTGSEDGHALAWGAYPNQTKVNENPGCSNSTWLWTSQTGTAYQWYMDGNMIAGATDSAYAATASGSYYCNVDGQNSTPLDLTIIPAPQASATANPTTVDLAIDPTGSVAFTNTSTGGDEYLWDFGGGFFSINENPSYSFITVGSHDVYFIVTDGVTGCSDTAMITIDVINTVSLGELDSEFKLFPNPVQNDLRISNLPTSENFAIQVIDITGRVVYDNTTVGKGTVVISMNNNPEGIYIVKIFNDEGQKTFKVIKD